MNRSFWIKRTLLVLSLVFGALVLVGWLRGQPTEQFLRHAALWSVISTTVYIVANVVRHLRGQRCELCDVPPSASDRGPVKRAPRN